MLARVDNGVFLVLVLKSVLLFSWYTILHITYKYGLVFLSRGRRLAKEASEAPAQILPVS